MTTTEQSAAFVPEAVPVKRLLELLPWILCVVSFAGVAVSVSLVIADVNHKDSLLFSVTCIVPATVGALVASRVRRNPIGWMLLSVALLVIVESLAEGYMDQRADQPEAGAVIWAAWLAEWVWIIPLAMAGVFIPLFFPNGRLLSPRWRYVFWLLAINMVVAVIAEVFNPGPMGTESGAINPVGIAGLGWLLDPLAGVTGALAGVGFFVAGASQVLRFRRSEGEEREQLKWIAFVVAIGVLGLAFAFASLALGENGVSLIIGTTGWITGLMATVLGMPLAIGIAILRYRLYDIDWIINRTLVYVPLTAMLAGIYVALTAIFRTLLENTTAANSDAAVAATTIIVVAALTPMKNHLQSVVDKHFKDNRDPTRALDSLAKEARAAAELLDTSLFVQRFLDTTVTSLGAKGAQLHLDANGIPRLFTSGDHESTPALTLSLRHAGSERGTLTIASRTNGRPYAPIEREALQRSLDGLAQLIASDTKTKAKERLTAPVS